MPNIGYSALKKLRRWPDELVMPGRCDVYETHLIDGILLPCRSLGTVTLMLDGRCILCRVFEDRPALGGRPGLDLSIPTALVRVLRTNRQSLQRDDPTALFFGATLDDDTHHQGPTDPNIDQPLARSHGTWMPPNPEARSASIVRLGAPSAAPDLEQRGLKPAHHRTWMQFDSHPTDRFNPNAPLEYRRFRNSRTHTLLEDAAAFKNCEQRASPLSPQDFNLVPATRANPQQSTTELWHRSESTPWPEGCPEMFLAGSRGQRHLKVLPTEQTTMCQVRQESRSLLDPNDSRKCKDLDGLTRGTLGHADPRSDPAAEAQSPQGTGGSAPRDQGSPAMGLHFRPLSTPHFRRSFGGTPSERLGEMAVWSQHHPRGPGLEG